VTCGRPGLRVWHAGRVPYRQALVWQEHLLAGRLPDAPDDLLLLEHPPVVTLGRGANRDHLLWSPAQLTSRGIELVATARGGDVTYHGPGQLVGYPLIDLNRCGRDLHLFLRRLEEVLIRTLAGFGLRAERCPGHTGVWIGRKKIASIGIAVRQWVTWHGFALNVAAQGEGFAAIVPCGLAGIEMTSVCDELGREVPLNEVAAPLIEHFATVFDRILIGIDEFTPAA
jgi:lipoate-protein ligase B